MEDMSETLLDNLLDRIKVSLKKNNFKKGFQHKFS
ncbi:hypothetical protein SMU81_04482 [Streptococcus mutans SF14]|nr:hypothetical protein SMU81_04482 [Streptococcus mutans SF14]